ncbi:MAG: hypothetical protein KDA46_06705 [Parvularculaceae bacterium]|nr:hypothetical protein [Parvularculaceae bacterium]
MLRNIAAVVIGLLAGAIVVYLVERAGQMLVASPADGEIGLGAKIAVVISWFAGVFCGACAGSLVARRWAPAAWVVTGALGGLTGMTLITIPHPLWMVLGALVSVVGGGWLAVKATGARYGAPPAKPDPMPGF